MGIIGKEVCTKRRRTSESYCETPHTTDERRKAQIALKTKKQGLLYCMIEFIPRNKLPRERIRGLTVLTDHGEKEVGYMSVSFVFPGVSALLRSVFRSISKRCLRACDFRPC